MEAIGGFIIFVSFAAFVLGVVNIFRPQGWMKVQKRLVGVFIILGSMGGCVAGAAMLPLPPPASEARVEVPAKKAASKPAKVSREARAPAAPARPTGMTQAEFTAVWSDVKARMERCDAPTRRAATALGTGDVYAAFAPTQAAAAACEDVWLKMINVPLPKSAKGEVRKAMKDAIDTCQTAMYAKREALKSLLKVLDGDQRPSTMNTVRTEMDRGKNGTLMCGIGFMGVAEEAGLVLPEVEEALKAAETQ